MRGGVPRRRYGRARGRAHDLLFGPVVCFLAALIDFESKFNPQAANPRSSAKGLLQFTNNTAQNLGYSDSLDLITKNPTFAGQIKNAVIPYLKKFAPFENQQSLYMAVFYPAARKWPINTIFPSSVREANPGITTISDYINKVNNRKLLPIAIPFSILLVILLIILFTQKEKKDNAEEETQK